MKHLNPVRAVTAPLSKTIASQGQLLDTLAKAVQGPLGSAVRATGPVGQMVRIFCTAGGSATLFIQHSLMCLLVRGPRAWCSI
jgi:hypothetical protein